MIQIILENLWLVLTGFAVHLVLQITACLHALFTKENSRATLGWIGFIVWVPYVGAFSYWIFGVNRVKTRSQKLLKRSAGDRKMLRELYPERYNEKRSGLQHAFEHFDSFKWNMLRAGHALTQTHLTPNNRVVPLQNGEEAFPVMLDCIRKAKSSVWLTTYIFETNDKGREFIAALIQATQRGVDVRVILDGVGEWLSVPRAGTILRRNGVRVARFLPPKVIPPQVYVNLRNHRKLLITDSKYAFTGGMNIGGRHMVHDPKNPHPVQDLHFFFEGPVVYDFARLFLEDWVFSARTERHESPDLPKRSSMEPLIRKRELSRRRRGPQLVQKKSSQFDVPTESVDNKEGVGAHHPLLAAEDVVRSLLQNDGLEPDAWCRVIRDGPDENLWNIETLLGSVLSFAQHRIVLFSPYFLPTNTIESALVSAALRGVDVTVVLPSNSNQPLVDRAMYRMMPWMLRNGVKFVVQPPPFAHTKLIVIDDAYTLLGSANMDPRSLRLNFELAVEVVDPALVDRLMGLYQPVIDRSTPLTLDQLKARAWYQKMVDSTCWLFSPYL